MFLQRPWQGLTAHQGAEVSSFGIAAIDPKTIFKSQKPQSVIVFAAVTTDGHKSPIIFVEANTKINSDIYIEILKDKISLGPFHLWKRAICVSARRGTQPHSPKDTGVVHDQFSWILGQVDLAPIQSRLKRNALLHMVCFREQGLC